jgi:hypothetical protein
VIFTGRVSEEEFRHERSLELARLEGHGDLEAKFAPPPSPRLLRYGRVGGTLAVLAGLSLFVMIVFAFFNQ